MAVEAIADFTGTNIAQLTVNGVISGSTYALVAVGFGMIIHIAHRFHIAYAAIYALTAFLAAQIQTSYGIPFVPALIVSTLIGVVLAVLIERGIYAPLAGRINHRERALFPVFVASLGISTAIEALINIVWAQPVTTTIGVSAVSWGPFEMTTLTIDSVVVTWVAIAVVAVVLKWTKLGRMIRAVRVNSPLSVDFGIRPSRIHMLVFAIGTALGGIGAVLLAAQSAPQSDMGENLVLFAITAAFIAGPSRNPLVIGLFALLMGLIQSWSTLFVSEAWSSFVIFAILLIYVIGKSARAVNWHRVFRRRPRVSSFTPDVVSEANTDPDAKATGRATADIEGGRRSVKRAQSEVATKR